MNNQRKTGSSKQFSEIDEDHLLHYIDGTMSAADQHRLEELLENDPFLSDAVEGLSEIHDKEQLKAITAQLNLQLKKQIQKKRKERRYRKKLTDSWGWIFVLIILMLALLSWWVIKVMAPQS